MLFHEGTLCWQIARMRLVLKWPVARTAAFVQRPNGYVNTVVSKYRAAVRAMVAVGDITKTSIVLADASTNQVGAFDDWSIDERAVDKEIKLLSKQPRYEDVDHAYRAPWRLRRLVPETSSAHAARDVLAAKNP